MCVCVWYRTWLLSVFCTWCLSVTLLLRTRLPLVMKRWPSEVLFFLSFKCVQVFMCLSLCHGGELWGYLAVFCFLFQVYDFRRTDGRLTGWHFSVAAWVYSWCDLDVGGEAVTVWRSNPIGLFIEWKRQNSPWWFSLFSFTSDCRFSEMYGACLMFSMLYLFMLG